MYMMLMYEVYNYVHDINNSLSLLYAVGRRNELINNQHDCNLPKSSPIITLLSARRMNFMFNKNHLRRTNLTITAFRVTFFEYSLAIVRELVLRTGTNVIDFINLQNRNI